MNKFYIVLSYTGEVRMIKSEDVYKLWKEVDPKWKERECQDPASESIENLTNYLFDADYFLCPPDLWEGGKF